MNAFFLILGSSACSALSGILLRFAAGRHLPSRGFGVESFPLYAGAIASYGLGFVLYALALRKLPLQSVYPAMVGLAMIQIFLYTRLTGESATASGVAGAILIVSGIYLVLRAA